MTFEDLSGHTSFNKTLHLHNVDILEKLNKALGFKQKYITGKDSVEILR